MQGSVRGTADGSIAKLAGEAKRLHRQGRAAEAQEICRRIPARDPANVHLNLLGLLAQGSGDHRAAVKMLERALSEDALNAAGRYNIGNPYQALGLAPPHRAAKSIG